MSTGAAEGLVITGIGELTTADDAEMVEGPAALVCAGDGTVAWVGRQGDLPRQAGTARVDVGGRAVIPGFVDSHTHLVFAGHRASEWNARMAGRPYRAGGIRTTVDATRAASDAELLHNAQGLADEALRSGTTTLEIKSGYGLDVAHEERILAVAAAISDERTFLGAHVVPAELAGHPDEYVELVCGPMLDRCAPHARWIDVFCDRGRSTKTSPAPCWPRGGPPASDCGCTPTNWRKAPGCAWAWSWAPPRWITAPSERRGHRGAGRLGHVAGLASRRDGGHPAARRRVLDPLVVPRRPPAARRGGHGGAGVGLQPGVELHHLDAVGHRPRRAGDAHDARRSAVGGHRGRRRRVAPPRPGAPGAGMSRRPGSSRSSDRVVARLPAGVDLVRTVVRGGHLVAGGWP